jgi:phosphoribosylformylglycinamidine synthase
VPVTGGNVSFYNQTAETPILPTPVVGVLGVIEDVSRRTPIGFVGEGRRILVLGTTRDEFDGSEWASVVHGHLGGRPPVVDLDAERRLAQVLYTASREGLVESAHDLSDGGLAQALVESALRYGVGASVVLPGEVDPFVALFSESAGRAIVAVRTEGEARFSELCESVGVAATDVGVTIGDGPAAALDVRDCFSVPLGELRSAWSATLPAALD